MRLVTQCWADTAQLAASPFRVGHLFRVLHEYDAVCASTPLDRLLDRYYRQHRSLGSKDRAFVGDAAHALVRHRVLLDYGLARSGWSGADSDSSAASRIDANSLGDSSAGMWQRRWRIYSDRNLWTSLLASATSLPPWVRVSMPQELYEMLVESQGRTEADRICQLANEQPAPVTLRVNTLRATREQVLAALAAEGVPASLVTGHPEAIRCDRRWAATASAAYRDGWFEVQDLGSQQVAALVRCRPGDTVLDYCAGAGGKSLALAHRLFHRGPDSVLTTPTAAATAPADLPVQAGAESMRTSSRLVLHDVREHVLREALQRLRRAGVPPGAVSVAGGQHRSSGAAVSMVADWVLVDAPCSGSGTLRRSSDARHRITRARVAEWQEQQRAVMRQASQYVRPSSGGRLVYATCSVLREENEAQNAVWQSWGWQVEEQLRRLPDTDGDGFWAVVLRRSVARSEV